MTELVVHVENTSLIDDILKAISMLRGVKDVKLKKRRKNGLDKAIEEVEKGNLYTVNSIEELINECKA